MEYLILFIFHILKTEVIEINAEIIKKLADTAISAREFSYSPYSNFKVGAALLCDDDSIYTGCNIENAAFSPTNCAERTAFFKAVSEGKASFKAIAVAHTYPCGVCLQVMTEFCEPESFYVVIVEIDGNCKIHTLSELLPKAFR